MAANQGPTGAGARPPHPAVLAARGERQESPPQVLQHGPAAVPDIRGPGLLAQDPGAVSAAPAVPKPTDALLTPPLQEHAHLPAGAAGAMGTGHRAKTSKHKTAGREHRAGAKQIRATAAVPEEVEQTDEHLRVLPVTFESHQAVAAEDQPQAGQQEPPCRSHGRGPYARPRVLPPVRPQLPLQPRPPSLWAPAMRAPLGKPALYSGSASAVVVHGYIQPPPQQQQRAGVVRVEEGAVDFFCAGYTIAALIFMLLWLYLAISATYRKGRSKAAIAEFSTMDADERELEMLLGAQETAATTESVARHTVSNDSDHHSTAVITATI
ncbi:uncharacterized protein [Dermacentor andersoni]|uniref:uncharacterized protein n=1 Tax=Dermacentor andersoni TaxID=34620 RepID=UPI002415F735|nr:uncharacterized protein LOC129387386 [Dermacentor andersoni]